MALRRLSRLVHIHAARPASLATMTGPMCHIVTRDLASQHGLMS